MIFVIVVAVRCCNATTAINLNFYSSDGVAENFAVAHFPFAGTRRATRCMRLAFNFGARLALDLFMVIVFIFVAARSGAADCNVNNKISKEAIRRLSDA